MIFRLIKNRILTNQNRRLCRCLITDTVHTLSTVGIVPRELKVHNVILIIIHQIDHNGFYIYLI